MTTDVVNSPKHYTQGKFETIDVIMDITKDLPGDEGYLVGNIVKYISRYNIKNGQEDLEKSQWYVKRLLELKMEKVRDREKATRQD